MKERKNKPRQLNKSFVSMQVAKREGGGEEGWEAVRLRKRPKSSSSRTARHRCPALAFRIRFLYCFESPSRCSPGSSGRRTDKAARPFCRGGAVHRFHLGFHALFLACSKAHWYWMSSARSRPRLLSDIAYPYPRS